MNENCLKICLDGKWKLFYEENCKCSKIAPNLTDIKSLQKSGFKCITGTVPGNFELDMMDCALLPDLFFGTNALMARKLENLHLWYATELFCGRPLTVVELNDICPAILCMWQPGTMGGKAAVSLLFGDKVPSGKLTMSWPRSVGQCPIYYNQTRTGRPCWGMEVQKKRSMTSNYIDELTYPLYAFGHGLSYTTFKYDDFKLSATEFSSGETITASIKVTNAGSIAADEVVQFYIKDHFGSVVRPVMELKDYNKIHLEAGESKVITFTIDEKMISFWRADMTYGAEAGEFTAFVGGSSKGCLQQQFFFK